MSFSGPLKCSVAAICLLGAAPAFADEFTWFGQTADGNWLGGVKVESVGHGRRGYDDSANIGIVLGYEFSRPIGLDGTSSIEFELTDSFDKGKVADSGVFGMVGEWQTENLGIHFAYRTPGNVYFKAKVGALRSNVTTMLSGLPSFREQDTSFSYGGGFGVKLGDTGNLALELEFSGTSGDNDLNIISIGTIYRFR